MPIQEQIVDTQKNFSEIELQEILNFADFLLGQPRKQEVASPPDETGNSQPANMDEECEVHYVGGVLVVKASLIKNQEPINWDTIIPDIAKKESGSFSKMKVQVVISQNTIFSPKSIIPVVDNIAKIKFL